MAGHSKFKNIMHRKGAQDKKRGKIFTKLIREITVAAKSGLPDPEMNPRLRSALIAARAENMPKDNIDRAIKKATDGSDGDNFEDIRYEGYAVKGIAVVVEALTDNRNRTASDVRTAFAKHGGALGETGSVSFMFDHIGVISYAKEGRDFDTVFEAAVEAGADNVEDSDESFDIITANDSLHAVGKALEQSLGEPLSAKLIWQPQNTIEVDVDTATSVLKLVNAIEDSDDVQTVYTSMDASDEILEQVEL